MYPSKINKEGAVALYIQVSINRKRKYLPLKIYWPATHCDFDRMEIKKRKPKDQEYTDTLLIISQTISKCNDIFVHYRLRETELSMDKFLDEFNHFTLNRDFREYFLNKVTERYRKGRISEQTRKNHTNTHNKIIEFQKRPLAFSDVTVKWCRDFQDWLRKNKKLGVNTIWSHMKDVNTYLNLAHEEDGIPVTNPFVNGYSYQPKESDIKALTKDQLRTLTEYYYSNKIPFNEKSVLGQFLFSCYTGLRISDLKTITDSNIIGDTLVFNPVKTQRFDKMQRIPLTRKAKEFILSEGGLIFEKYVDQSSNRILKKIAKVCEIPFKLTNHVGRHSFATLFLELGGNVEVLQKLLGHSKISTTMKYVHVNEKRKTDQMANFDKLDF